MTLRAQRELAKKVALTKERLIAALGPAVFGNVADFITIGPDGSPRVDFSRCTREQLGAIQSIQVEEFLDDKNRVWNSETSKFEAREVRRVKFTLRPSVPAAMAVARLMAWIVEAPTGVHSASRGRSAAALTDPTMTMQPTLTSAARRATTITPGLYRPEIT